MRALDTPGSQRDSARLLYLLVFGGGAATIAIEMAASRPLAPYFGNSLPVWSVLIGVGQQYLGLGGPRLTTIAADGRHYLAATSRQYDLVILDAYRPPYTPVQLTTREFFELAREHLKTSGLVVVNVARTETDYALVDAIAATLRAVLPQVYIVDARSDLNSMVIGLREANDVAAIRRDLAWLAEPLLRNVAARAEDRIREYVPGDQIILTDDLAPVERIVHGIILRYLFGQPAREVS